MRKVIITKNFEETRKAGEELIIELIYDKKNKPNQAEVVALYGDLGSGKTTFTQGVARGLGIKKRIISPTFVLVRTYDIATKNPASSAGSRKSNKDVKLQIKKFYHIDLYRVSRLEEIKKLGLTEIMEDKNNLVVIEWAGKMRDLLPKKRWDIFFAHFYENSRIIHVNPL